MRYWVRLFTALALVGGGLATLGIAISQLAETGSCSTGGTPDNLPDCPSDTVWWVLSIFGAVLSFVVGLVVLATRGSRSGSDSTGAVGPVTVRPVTSYSPPPPALPTTWPVGGEEGGGAEDPEGDPLDRLAKLGELKQAGVISESEFELQKAKLLSDI